VVEDGSPSDRKLPERLALGEASRLLGVDPDTLRRWADEGRVPAFTTPGGHRRFERRALERMIAARRTGPVGTLAAFGATQDRLSAAYRRRYGEFHGGSDPDPRATVPETDRETFRETGRRLVDALVRHLDETGPARATAARDAVDLAGDLGDRLARHGVPLPDAVAMFLSARRPFLAELNVMARRRGVDGALRCAVRHDDEPARPLLLAFVAAHTAAMGPAYHVPRGRGRGSPAMTALLPTLTALLALVFALMLLDQWRERRRGFQLVWAFGMLAYAIGAGAEAIAAAGGWSETLYRAWYLAGAVWTAAWLGLGTAFLLGRTRFGYTYAVLLLVSGLVALMIRNNPSFEGAGPLPVLYLIGAVILALAVGVETYFGNERWPRFAAGAIVGTTVLSIVLMLATPPLPAPGYALSATTGQPVGDAMPGYLRLLTPVMNVPGALSLLLGAVFSAYVFMPKKRVLPYSLDPDQPGDPFRFNLCIAPVAIVVNLVASLPGAGRDLLAGRLHSRVPATILIAIGAFFPTITDSLTRLGSTELFQLGKFLGVVFLFAGFLVSIEVFREVRVPFTSIRLGRARHEPAGADGLAAAAAAARELPAPCAVRRTRRRPPSLPSDRCPATPAGPDSH
jgi:excisionase family DNA binding protein